MSGFLRLPLTEKTASSMVLRAQLKHSWLENEVLNKAPETVLFLRNNSGWPALHGFPSSTEQAIALAMQVENGFSPAQLVDECLPLLALSDTDRAAVRDAVHSAYLECFDATSLADELQAAAVEMDSALTAMIGEWNLPDESVRDAVLREYWQVVLTSGERLRAALDALPKGIVLP